MKAVTPANDRSGFGIGYEVVDRRCRNARLPLNADRALTLAHSLSPVPITVVSKRVAAVQSGAILADVAPTDARDDGGGGAR